MPLPNEPAIAPDGATWPHAAELESALLIANLCVLHNGPTKDRIPNRHLACASFFFEGEWPEGQPERLTLNDMLAKAADRLEKAARKLRAQIVETSPATPASPSPPATADDNLLEWRAPAQGPSKVRAPTAQAAAEKLVKLHSIAPGLPFGVEQLDDRGEAFEGWRFVALQNGGAIRTLQSAAASSLRRGFSQATKATLEALDPMLERLEAFGRRQAACAHIKDPLLRLDAEKAFEAEEYARANGEGVKRARPMSVEALKREPRLLEAARQVHDEIKASMPAGMRAPEPPAPWGGAVAGRAVEAVLNIGQATDVITDALRAAYEATTPAGLCAALDDMATAAARLAASAAPPPAPVGPDVDMLRAAVVGCAVAVERRSFAAVDSNGELASDGARALGEACRLYLRALEALGPFEGSTT